ncbi:hypothetical protein BD770DRAFT_466608 [Pilaira anomala]|nr:hypothetical protein BD770DRAFT_466608 [Pilaira anomala]
MYLFFSFPFLSFPFLSFFFLFLPLSFFFLLQIKNHILYHYRFNIAFSYIHYSDKKLYQEINYFETCVMHHVFNDCTCIVNAIFFCGLSRSCSYCYLMFGISHFPLIAKAQNSLGLRKTLYKSSIRSFYVLHQNISKSPEMSNTGTSSEDLTKSMDPEFLDFLQYLILLEVFLNHDQSWSYFKSVAVLSNDSEIIQSI